MFDSQEPEAGEVTCHLDALRLSALPGSEELGRGVVRLGLSRRPPQAPGGLRPPSRFREVSEWRRKPARRPVVPAGAGREV
jgi:hypothetical protein